MQERFFSPFLNGTTFWLNTFHVFGGNGPSIVILFSEAPNMPWKDENRDNNKAGLYNIQKEKTLLLWNLVQTQPQAISRNRTGTLRPEDFNPIQLVVIWFLLVYANMKSFRRLRKVCLALNEVPHLWPRGIYDNSLRSEKNQNKMDRIRKIYC